MFALAQVDVPQVEVSAVEIFVKLSLPANRTTVAAGFPPNPLPDRSYPPR